MLTQHGRADNLTVCYYKKQIDISFSCICPVIDSEFRYNIVKVDCRSTQLSPHGSAATLIDNVMVKLAGETCE